ncbi:cupin domain-containing protein [Chryseobacterium sp. AG844]|uniref:cupin domain-containing protein n=1 Tax=Chryseobacterium sp. AG844 TaxID=2183998 RepID=UPI000D70BD78|nr:cupin domain-containing protein [Chryseobacterium sp. AG844]
MRFVPSSYINLKFEPEASYPYHNHPAGEELFILEGVATIAGARLEKGDYLHTPPDFKHSVKSEHGCTILFVVPEESYPTSEFIDFESTIEEFLGNLNFWIKNSRNGLIVNLDIDYFYSQHKKLYKIYSDELIINVATILLENMDKIDVLTIALSPECCGGWENAFKTLKVINNIMDLGLEI